MQAAEENAGVSVEEGETTSSSQQESTEVESCRIEDGLLKEIRFNLLNSLNEKLQVAENVGGERAIPYFQVRLFLKSI